jgi:hypothetical protein
MKILPNFALEKIAKFSLLYRVLALLAEHASRYN